MWPPSSACTLKDIFPTSRWQLPTRQLLPLLPKTDKQGGLATAEKLLQCVRAEEFPRAAESQPGGSLTVSFGITEFPVDSKNIYELLNLADRALYAAKKEGRNCAIAWEGPAPPTE